jgi:hypothetical protein
MVDFTDNNLIQQTERLLTVRPRSTTIGPQPGGGGNRGVRTRIRLLTNDAGLAKKRAANSFVTGNDTADFVTSRLITSDPGMGFSDFLLTNVQVTYNEKVQITPTFGDSEVVYYFGKAPVIFQLGGILIDDVDNQWFTTFVETYSHILRGTELARNHELIEITLPNMVVIGSIMSLSHQQDAARDTDIPFTMTMHAKEIRPLPVQLPSFPFASDAKVINFKEAQGFTSFSTLNDINKFKANIDKGIANIPAVLTGTKNIGGITDSIGAILGNKSGANGVDTTASLTSFKGSLFSPIFGVLTSITKVIKSVTGDISRIISSFTNPVNTILREIRGVAAEAIKITNLVTKSITDLVNIPLKLINEVRKTIIALRHAAGLITRAPETIALSIRRLFRKGALKGNAAFLTKGGRSPNNKIALLASGPIYSLSQGASTGAT